jgi:hypothetical protein
MNTSAKIGLVTLFMLFLLFAVIYGPAYITGYTEPVQNDGWRYELNESQLETANALRGSDMTVGEFYEKVCPEYLDTMPEETKEFLYTTKMEWPEPT